MNIDPRYQRGKIYTIRSHKTPLVYVGSTIEKSLKNRLSSHKGKYKQYKKGEVNYYTSFDILKIDENCYIELYEEYPCENKAQLDRREGQVIRELDCVNKNVAGRTQKEYQQDNKENIKARKNQYYITHKEEISEKVKQYQQDNKENIKARKNQYYITHKEEISEKSKEYRTKNKERISAKKKQKFQCECGGKYTDCHKARHMKTKKHQEYMDFMYN